MKFNSKLNLSLDKFLPLLLTTALAGVAVFFIKTYVFSFASVDGQSMMPFLKPGDLVFVAKWIKQPRPGQVIVISVPARGVKLVKRLIAIGPAEVSIDNFKLFVNGREFQESFKSPPTWDRFLFHCAFSPMFKVETGALFYLGDNRCNSADSRSFLITEKDKFEGRVLFRIFPSFGWIN